MNTGVAPDQSDHRNALAWLWGLRAAVSWSLIDQVVVSLGSLLTGLLLVRLAGPSEYGVYVLVFSVYLALQSVQSGLITAPLTVFGAHQQPQALRRYTRSAAKLQLVLTAVSSLGLLLTAGGFAFAGHRGALTQALWALSVAVVLMQAQEFMRRWLLTRLKMRAAAINDALHQGLRFTGILLCVWLEINQHQHAPTLSAAVVVWVFAAAGALAVVIGALQIRAALRGTDPLESTSSSARPNHARLRGTLRRHWRFGRWQIVSAGITFLYTQGVYFYLAAVADETAVGLLDGPRLLVAPCMLLIMAWGNLAGPLAARQLTIGGIRAVSRVVQRLAPMLLIAVGLCAFVMTSVGGWLMQAVFGAAFTQDGALPTTVLTVWAWVMVMSAVSTVSAAVFSATRRPFYGTACRALGAIAGLMSLLWVGGQMTVASAAYCRLAAEAAVAIASVFFAVRLLRPTISSDTAQQKADADNKTSRPPWVLHQASGSNTTVRVDAKARAPRGPSRAA